MPTKIEWVLPDGELATKLDLEDAVEKLSGALGSLRLELLDALARIGTGPTVPQAGFAIVNGTQFDNLLDAANAVPLGGIVEIHGEMRDLKASAGFPLSCTIRGATPNAKLNWTLGTTERMALGKGLIVCSGIGQTYTIENLELCGARVVDRNGAGIRGDAAASVTVRNCNIHDNENGVLSVAAQQFYYGNTFKNNGNSSGSAHGIYANLSSISEVVAEDNIFYAAVVGNQFKSRAKRTTFRRNLVAELDGACAWQIDLPNGGDCLIEKNVIEQGPAAQNRNMISYGPEGIPADGRTNALTILDNIIFNDHAQGAWGVNIFNPPATSNIARNSFIGLFTAHVLNGAMDGTNQTFATRADAGYAAYPFLPPVPA